MQVTYYSTCVQPDAVHRCIFMMWNVYNYYAYLLYCVYEPYRTWNKIFIIIIFFFFRCVLSIGACCSRCQFNWCWLTTLVGGSRLPCSSTRTLAGVVIRTWGGHRSVTTRRSTVVSGQVRWRRPTRLARSDWTNWPEIRVRCGVFLT